MCFWHYGEKIVFKLIFFVRDLEFSIYYVLFLPTELNPR